MESEARYTYVGAAIVALVAALVLSLLWLQRAGMREQFRFYAIDFERTPLDGLQVGGDVEMRGIKVGRVEDYALAGRHAERVHVVVRVDRRTPVSENTSATLSRNYLTGIARISLVTPQPPGPPLVRVAPGETLPVIAEGRSDYEQLRLTLGQLGEESARALRALNATLGADNREALRATLDALRELAGGLGQRLGALDAALASFDRAATRLGRSGERMADAAEGVGRQLAPTLEQSQRTLQDASAALRSLQRDASSLAQRLDAVAASADDRMGVALGELRQSADALVLALERLEDPRAALVGPAEVQLGPGERAR